MKLKVLLLVIPVIMVIFYIIVATAMKAFKICSETEYFAEERKPNTMSQLLDQMENEKRMQDSRAAQDKKITEIGATLDVDDPISDAYLPYSFNIYKKDLPSADDLQAYNNYEYIITTTYKKVLDRNPTDAEFKKNIELFKSGTMNEDLLRTYLYNSTEYSIISRVQSNEINNDLGYSTAKEDMLIMISNIYLDSLEVEVPKAMLLPLRDMFMYFENDKYMLKAFLYHDNYKLFQDEVINARRLKKENILDVYRKHINEDEVKYIANDLRREDILNRVNQNSTLPSSLPVNTSFQGADLGIVTNGAGAGSGAQAADFVPPTDLDYLLAKEK